MSSEPRYKIDSEAMYTIFREVLRREETYKSEIAEDLDKSIGTIGDTLDSLQHYGIIEETRRTKAQYYSVNLEGLVSVFEDVWDLDSTPDEFQGFLEEYVAAYVGFEASSSIRDTLRDDFAEALLSYERDHSLPEWLQNLRSDLSGELEAYRPKEDYLEKALD